MADVQLEHGHVRIANALEEAIIYAKFSATQMKIVRCIIRLTWGWRRRTVRISHNDLALRCNTTAAGGFRRELQELIREGVILEIETAHGRTAGVYAINKDFEKWGRLSVSASALDALFGERPDHADATDKVPQQGQATLPFPTRRVPLEGQETDERKVPPEGHPNSRRVPQNEPLGAPVGAPKNAGRAPISPVTPETPSGSESGKTVERQKDINSESHAREETAAAADLNSYSTAIRTAAVRAVARRWPEHTLLTAAAGILGAQLEAAGVDLAFAVETINHQAATMLDGPPISIAYFQKRVLDRHRERAHEQLKREANGTDLRGGPPVSLAAMAGPSIDIAALEREYHDVRRQAAFAWGKDPANAAAYLGITTAANEKYAGLLESTWGRNGRDSAIVLACAEHAGVPSFEEWLRARADVAAEPITAERGAAAHEPLTTADRRAS